MQNDFERLSKEMDMTGKKITGYINGIPLCKSYSASNVAERKFEYFQQIKKEQANIITEISRIILNDE